MCPDYCTHDGVLFRYQDRLEDIILRIRMKSVVALLLVSMMLFNLTGCGIFDNAGKKVADSYVDNYVEKVEFEVAKNDPSPDGSAYNPNGTTLYETILFEDILTEDKLYEDILNEEILEERLLKEILYDEGLIYEDVLIEELHVEIIEDVDELEDRFVCESYYDQQFDYDFIKQRIASGTSLILAEVVVDLGSCILNIVTANWGGVALDAGQIVVTAGGSTLAGFIAYHVAKAKSEAAGNSYEQVMYDALYEGSNAYYYTAVTCDVVNTVISVYQLVDGMTKLVKTVKNLIKVMKTPEIANSAGNVVAKLRTDGLYDVAIDGKKAIKCAFAENSTDLYDAATKEYVCSIVKNGDVLTTEINSIPKQIFSKSTGALKFEVDDAGMLYRLTENIGGEYVKTTIGTIDAGGVVKNGFGQNMYKLDFESGNLIKCYNGVNKIAPNITVDVFGNIIDLNTNEKLAVKTIDGVVTYLDADGNAVATIYKGEDGIQWLKNVNKSDNGTTIGRISEEGIFESAWKADLNFIRSDATSTIRKQLVNYVKNNSDANVRKNFPDLTVEKIEYIRDYGRVPESIQIHHCKNVANYPDLAHDYSNLEVMSIESHKAAHGGNYQNSTTAKSSNYVDLKVLFGL